MQPTPSRSLPQPLSHLTGSQATSQSYLSSWRLCVAGGCREVGWLGEGGLDRSNTQKKRINSVGGPRSWFRKAQSGPIFSHSYEGTVDGNPRRAGRPCQRRLIPVLPPGCRPASVQACAGQRTHTRDRPCRHFPWLRSSRRPLPELVQIC